MHKMSRNYALVGIVIIVAVMLTAGSSVFLSGCKSSDKTGKEGQKTEKTNPNKSKVDKPKPGDAQTMAGNKADEKPAHTYRTDEPHPIIIFDAPAFDFGESAQEQELNHSFKFKNTGERDLEIVSVRPNCACIVATSSSPVVAKGKDASIDIVFKTGRYQGKKSKTITVNTNDPEHAQATLTVSTDIMVEFALEPATLYMGRLSKTETVTRNSRVLAKEPDKLKISKVESSNEFITAKTTTIETQAAGQPNQAPPANEAASKSNLNIEVTLKPGMKVGRFTEKVTVTTNLEKMPTYTLNVAGEIVGDITAEPRMVSFRRAAKDAPPEASSRAIKVATTTSKSFDITKVECTDPNFTANFAPVEKGKSYTVTVALDKAAPDKFIRAELVISLNDKEQPEIKIPVYASPSFGPDRGMGSMGDRPPHQPPGQPGLPGQAPGQMGKRNLRPGEPGGEAPGAAPEEEKGE